MLSKGMLNKHSVIWSNWLSFHFKSNFWIWMFKFPYCIKYITFYCTNFLFSRYLCTSCWCLWKWMKIKCFIIRYSRICYNSEMLSVMQYIITIIIWFFCIRNYNKHWSYCWLLCLCSCNIVCFFCYFQSLLNIYWKKSLSFQILKHQMKSKMNVIILRIW